MFTSALLFAVSALATLGAARPYANSSAGVLGFDVSHWNANVDFAAAYSGGLRFAYAKATQGTSFKDPTFQTYFAAAASAGLVRGAYHFAAGTGDGSQEASYFLANGGAWSAGTLPGMLDLEGACKSVAWIQTFSDTYHSATGVYPVIYTDPAWWQKCTAGSTAFAATNPLMLARYNSVAGTPPGGWSEYTIWQYNKKCQYGGDSDRFQGTLAQLQAFASSGSLS